MQDTRYQTSAGGVVLHDGKVLTIKWRTKNAIELPKGKLDPGESAEDAALREVKEETGYDVRIISALPSVSYEFDLEDGIHYHKIVHFFLMELANSDAPIPEREEQETFDTLWLSFDDALRLLTFEDSRELLRRALSLR